MMYEFNGKSYSIRDLCRITGKSRYFVSKCLYKAKSMEEFFKIIDDCCDNKMYVYKGEKYSLKQLSEIAGIGHSSMLERLKKFLTVEEAVEHEKYKR